LALLDIVLAGVVGVGAFVLYLRTLAPGLLSGDSGEFQVLARLLGTTHNTGYPVYLLLAHPFTWLPVENVAYRVNLFSAVMAALAVVAVFIAARLLTHRRGAALLGAAALAVSSTLWSQALIAEVYTAAAFFLAAILALLMAWRATDKWIYLFAAGLMGGLSLGVHMTVALAAPAILVYLLLTARDRRSWVAAIGGALIGLILYLAAFFILDWRAPTANFIDAAIGPSRSIWGLSEDDLGDPLTRYWFTVSGRQFQDRMLQIETLPKNIFRYISGLGREFHGIALLLTAIGIVWLASRAGKEAALLALALLGQWIYTFTYDIWDLHVFFIPGYVILALLAASGAAAVEEAIARPLVRWPNLRPAMSALLTVIVLAVTVWPILAPRWEDVARGRVPQFEFDGYPVDHFNLTGLTNSVTATVRNLPEDAILFARWPELYPLYYAAHVEQNRQDLTFHEEKPYGGSAADENSTIQYIEARIDAHPIYFTECLPELRAAGYRCEPERLGTVLYQRVRR
jgi:4-amino-4-deoxy-L-arabinose transferase-like glycosyltransferase